MRAAQSAGRCRSARLVGRGQHCGREGHGVPGTPTRRGHNRTGQERGTGPRAGDWVRVSPQTPEPGSGQDPKTWHSREGGGSQGWAAGLPRWPGPQREPLFITPCPLTMKLSSAVGEGPGSQTQFLLHTFPCPWGNFPLCLGGALPPIPDPEQCSLALRHHPTKSLLGEIRAPSADQIPSCLQRLPVSP